MSREESECPRSDSSEPSESRPPETDTAIHSQTSWPRRDFCSCVPRTIFCVPWWRQRMRSSVCRCVPLGNSMSDGREELWRRMGEGRGARGREVKTVAEEVFYTDIPGIPCQQVLVERLLPSSWKSLETYEIHSRKPSKILNLHLGSTLV